MIRDTLAKTAQALDVASLVENVAADDVVNQACYTRRFLQPDLS